MSTDNNNTPKQLSTEQSDTLINTIKQLHTEYAAINPNFLTDPALFHEFITRYEQKACEVIPERRNDTRPPGVIADGPATAKIMFGK